MVSTQTLYEGEKRAIEITLTDQDDAVFEPTVVYTTIYNEDDEVVRVYQEAYLTSNRMYDIVDTTVTANTGNYYIVWKIVKSEYIYYHRTSIVVLSL